MSDDFVRVGRATMISPSLKMRVSLGRLDMDAAAPKYGTQWVNVDFDPQIRADCLTMVAPDSLRRFAATVPFSSDQSRQFLHLLVDIYLLAEGVHVLLLESHEDFMLSVRLLGKQEVPRFKDNSERAMINLICALAAPDLWQAQRYGEQTHEQIRFFIGEDIAMHFPSKSIFDKSQTYAGYVQLVP
jgi:hypothetical protein